MRKHYPSDISREQFESIRPFLDTLRKRIRPRAVDLYDVLCAVLYVLKSGCQWRMLPGDFPKWRTVYFYWVQWSRPDSGDTSPLEKALKHQVAVNPCRSGAPCRYTLSYPGGTKRIEHRHSVL